VLPTDAPHLSQHAAPLALAMSPLLWSTHRPDCFDTYSAGVVLMQLAVPPLRATAALRSFNSALARCGHDLEEWRAKCVPPAWRVGWLVVLPGACLGRLVAGGWSAQRGCTEAGLRRHTWRAGGRDRPPPPGSRFQPMTPARRASLPARQTAALDANGGQGWDLAAGLLRARAIDVDDATGRVRFKSGGAPRLTANAALRHPFLREVRGA
jgi:hypothetical protein